MVFFFFHLQQFKCKSGYVLEVRSVLKWIGDVLFDWQYEYFQDGQLYVWIYSKNTICSPHLWKDISV